MTRTSAQQGPFWNFSGFEIVNGHLRGGRRARTGGRLRLAHDFALLAATVNLARLAQLQTAAAPA